MVRSFLDRVRAPEFTGPNRCWPCTGVNLVLVALAAGLVGLVSVPAGVLLAGVGCLAVRLRGYVVPGTPRLTRRFLPAAVLELFGKTPADRRQSAGTTLPAGADPGRTLRTLGVIDGESEPELSPGFRASWTDAAARLAGDRGEPGLGRALAETLSVAPADVAVETSGRRGVAVTVDGEWVGEWPSRTALVADAATERVLSDSRWTDLSRPARADLAARIRGLAGHCPVCGADTRVSGDTVESCCREADVVAVACPTCGRLAEFEQSPAAFAAGR